jgi:hypothetical protein
MCNAVRRPLGMSNVPAAIEVCPELIRRQKRVAPHEAQKPRSRPSATWAQRVRPCRQYRLRASGEALPAAKSRTHRDNRRSADPRRPEGAPPTRPERQRRPACLRRTGAAGCRWSCASLTRSRSSGRARSPAYVDDDGCGGADVAVRPPRLTANASLIAARSSTLTATPATRTNVTAVSEAGMIVG